MLITTFSSGELSKNLYGRSDLPQYYSGAARLENFDVIPTGGIKRRPGTERVLPLGAEGRLIPFNVDRENHFLLYLTPGKIQAVKNGEIKQTFPSTDTLKLYGTLGEIREVQYAQNFDTMVLCHEKYPPLEVQIENSKINISAFYIECKEKIITTGINDAEYILADDDEEYKQNKYLVSDGNYPRSATFFMGRVIFAGTKNNPQRVFASRADNPHWFSTYNTFITRAREYITVNGTVRETSKKIIKLNNTYIDAMKFVYDVNKYFVDSVFFPEGTRVVSMKGDTLLLNNESKAEEEMNQQEKDELDALIIKYQNYVRDTVSVKIGSIWCEYGIPYGEEITANIQLKLAIRFNYNLLEAWVEADYYTGDWYWKEGQRIYIKQTKYCQKTYLPTNFWEGNGEYVQATGPTDTPSSGKPIGEEFFVEMPLNVFRDKVVTEIIEQSINELKNTHPFNSFTVTQNGPYANPSIFYNYYLGLPPYTADGVPRKLKEFPSITADDISDENIRQIAGGWRLRTIEVLIYKFRKATTSETVYYDTPDNIKMYIEQRLSVTSNIYIPLYTEKDTVDRYPTPDCGFTFEIASDMNDSIRWLAANKGLIVGTETAEWVVPPGVDATNVQATLNSRYGSDRIQGTAVNDATCFFQTGKKALVEYYIPQTDNNFRANNMALLSPDMLGESPAVEFDFARSPYTKLFVTREDGIVAALLYERGTGTFAWGRVTTGKETAGAGGKPGRTGLIKSVAVLPGLDGHDDIYLAVKRGDGFFLEVLKEAGAVFLDSWEPYGGSVEGYSADEAVVYDPAERKTYPLGGGQTPPPAKAGRVIGYPYRSFIRSMPVLANNQMRPNNISSLLVRFLDSFMPRVHNAGGGHEDTINLDEPFSGIAKVAYPGGWDRDVMFELIFDKPERGAVLAVNAEAR